MTERVSNSRFMSTLGRALRSTRELCADCSAVKPRIPITVGNILELFWRRWSETGTVIHDHEFLEVLAIGFGCIRSYDVVVAFVVCGAMRHLVMKK